MENLMTKVGKKEIHSYNFVAGVSVFRKVNCPMRIPAREGGNPFLFYNS